MTDVLEEIRRFRSLELNPHYQRLFDASADEIKRLRAEVERLRRVFVDDDGN